MVRQITTRWKKSTRSGDGGNCLEVRLVGGRPQIRDSKLGDASPILSLSPAVFESLLSIAKATERDSND